ncbi:adenylate/guanylate cyclase domain-containing protein [Candidatus Nucleicultrix amoebiphila]|uniref:Guanylate cyclase domain-containing protein n=1 Tax=Candidatus Nucleicultrix amoebiphila FS5 TaxID=1414854 RepID=A0A1W6N6F1_9PROT|nr:adenylate/guanylate cyclase domain-containing protein [Candidatus Nucleicultrix amoebiphila]ARN85352.1 hypothetical protein GQ61_08700 [Candidatus Nucleicultrix amoebiphila FS5]
MWLLNHWRSRRLYVDIVASFFLLLLITCAAISWYTYQNNSSALINIADDLILQTSRASIDKTIDYLEQSRTLTELGTQLITSSKDLNVENKQLLSFMKWGMRSYSFIASLYIGTEDGKFLQVRRLPPNATYRADPAQLLPGGSYYAIRFVDRSTKGAETEVWSYVDQEGKTLDTETLNKVMYDHRGRDWYQNVNQSRSFKWSDIYVFNSSQLPGLTAANPIFSGNQFMGVMAADIEIAVLSGFLRDSKIGKYGKAFIVSSKGEIIAHSHLENTSIVEGNKIRMVLVNDLKDMTLKMAFKEHVNNKKDKFVFQYEGNDYLAYFMAFPGSFNKNWGIGVVAPVDAFIGTAKATNYRILLMSIIILIVSSLVVLLIAMRIAKPIMTLAEETKKIRSFDLQGDEEVKSSIFEIQVLNEAMVAMRQSMRTFSKFIPKILVSKLIKTGQDMAIGGKSRKATLLFTDVANFTTLSENYPPDKLIIHLSEYFEEITQIIMQSNGIIDKFIGDAVMAFWGAPTPDRAQAIHACVAALKFKKRLLELNRKWKFEGKPELPTRIGIHTGEVIIGNVGSSDRLNYTALGDSVNLASRLEGVNKMYGTEIIISEEVYKEVSAHALARPLDVVAVKGKNRGIKIYELIGLMGDDPVLLPTEEQTEFCKLFTKAFQVYLEKRWDEAIRIFQEIVTKFGQDQTAVMYIKRCKEFKKKAPPKDWDGVVHLKSK